MLHPLTSCHAVFLITLSVCRIASALSLFSPLECSFVAPQGIQRIAIHYLLAHTWEKRNEGAFKIPTGKAWHKLVAFWLLTRYWSRTRPAVELRALSMLLDVHSTVHSVTVDYCVH